MPTKDELAVKLAKCETDLANALKEVAAFKKAGARLNITKTVFAFGGPLQVTNSVSQPGLSFRLKWVAMILMPVFLGMMIGNLLL